MEYGSRVEVGGIVVSELIMMRGKVFVDVLFRFVFFFQAEDGIRGRDVTGVQTCALPISPRWVSLSAAERAAPPPHAVPSRGTLRRSRAAATQAIALASPPRSRRVP